MIGDEWLGIEAGWEEVNTPLFFLILVNVKKPLVNAPRTVRLCLLEGASDRSDAC